MKKSISIILLVVLATTVMAQDDEKQPKFRFGLKIAPSVAWLGPDKTKFNGLSVENSGAKIKFGYGLITEFVLAKNYSFLTGVEVTYLGGVINYKDAHSAWYQSDSLRMYIKSREYKQQYITIPIALKLKTNEIGYMTYFGQIGVDASFKIKGRANDEGALYSDTTTFGNPTFNVFQSDNNRDDVDILKQINLFRIALNVGIGAEWNLAGNTSLLFAVNYNNGFTNFFYNKTKDENKLRDNSGERLEEKASSNYVALTVGVLF